MKMMSRKLAMPLLGVLLWVMSIHAGSFATATLLPRPLTGLEVGVKEDPNILKAKIDNLKIPGKDLNQSVSFGHGVINRMLRLETNLQWSKVHVRQGTPSHGLLIVSNPEEEALRQGRDALVASKATAQLINSFCLRRRLDPKECAKAITAYSLDSTPLEASCQKLRKVCTQEDILSPYRSVDGSCNHRSDGSRGSSFTAYSRLLHPAYLDGIQAPRRSITKKKLPSARLVSSSLVKKIEESDSDTTLAVVQWSQFVEHDLSHTAVSKMVHSDHTIECCAASGHHLSPRYIHPFCSAISVPHDDAYYAKHGLDCMTYVRSIPAFSPGCTFGPLEQMNQATHYLDASQIYGSTGKKSAALRMFLHGQLRVSRKRNREFLPVSRRPSDDCQVDQLDAVCFVSGDSRVNVQPQLTAMHTIWLREHNRIARELGELNPTWDDETLFQEARRIVIAEIQHITYDHWLPQVLGKTYFNKIEKYREYNEAVNPAVSNGFATASVRALNSLMDGNLRLYTEDRLVNSSLNLRDHFNNPAVIEQPGYLDALVRGLATQSSQQMDLRFAEDISNHLFSNGAFGYDVLSLDIQRGRDHGLPTYTAYRTLCGLPEAKTFDDFLDVMSPEVARALSEVYSSPRDVDLIVGGMSERATGDSLFGPTLSCLVADQYLRTRRGDRYFYTNEHQPVPFSAAQIRQIREVTLARVFCDNGDDIQEMQPNVFRKISERNDLRSCDSDEIPRMDLRVWEDSRGRYY